MKPAPRSSAVRVSSLSIWTISGCRRTSMGQHASGERFITGFRAEFSTTPATRPVTRQYASVGYFSRGLLMRPLRAAVGCGGWRKDR